MKKKKLEIKKINVTKLNSMQFINGGNNNYLNFVSAETDEDDSYSEDFECPEFTVVMPCH